MFPQATTKTHFEQSEMQFSAGCCSNITRRHGPLGAHATSQMPRRPRLPGTGKTLNPNEKFYRSRTPKRRGMRETFLARRLSTTNFASTFVRQALE
jgi:hypothetical protein